MKRDYAPASGGLRGALVAPSKLVVPLVASIVPSFGPLAGGTSVDIYGLGFSKIASASQVTIDGVAVQSGGFNVVSDTHIQAVTSASSAGVGQVLVGASSGGPLFSYLDGGVYDWWAEDAPVVAGAWSGNWVDRLGGKTMVPQNGNPAVLAADVQGHPAVQLNGQTGFCASLTLAQPCTAWMVFRNDLWAAGHIILDSNGGNFLVQQYASSPDIDLYAGTASVADNPNLLLTQYGVVEMHFDGANSYVRVAGNAKTTGNPGAVGMSGAMYLASFSGGVLANITVARLLLANSAAAGYDSVAYRNALTRDYFGERNVLIGSGDSITLGNGASDATRTSFIAIAGGLLGSSYLHPYPTDFGRPNRCVIFIPPGHTDSSDSLAPGGEDLAAVTYAGSKRFVISALLGSNDIAFGRTPAQIKADNPQFLANRKAAIVAAGGPSVRVLGGTLLPRLFASDQYGTFTQKEAYRQQINADILANPSQYGYDAVADYASLPQAADPNSTTFYADGVHPTDALYAPMGNLAASTITAQGWT